MTKDTNAPDPGTVAEYLVHRLNDKQNGEDFAIEYLKTSFLTSAIQALCHVRRNAHLTQEQVAQKLGKKQAAIARWEADFDGKISLRQYVEIALACGVIPLPIKKFEPVFSVRDYLIENPGAQWTQDLYESWQKKKLQPQSIAQNISEYASATFQPNVTSAQSLVASQSSTLTVQSIEHFLEEGTRKNVTRLVSTSEQRPIENMNLTSTSQGSKSVIFAQSIA